MSLVLLNSRNILLIIVANYALDKLKMEITDNWLSKVTSSILKKITVPEVEKDLPLLGSLCKYTITAEAWYFILTFRKN